MFADDDGLPLLGTGSGVLGVRSIDLPPDNTGSVHPMNGGVSVTTDVATLPPHLRPATKVGGLWDGPVFVMLSAELPETLTLRQQGKKLAHHVIEPTQSMLIQVYVDAVNSTRACWRIANV